MQPAASDTIQYMRNFLHFNKFKCFLRVRCDSMWITNMLYGIFVQILLVGIESAEMNGTKKLKREREKTQQKQQHKKYCINEWTKFVNYPAFECATKIAKTIEIDKFYLLFVSLCACAFLYICAKAIALWYVFVLKCVYTMHPFKSNCLNFHI